MGIMGVMVNLRGTGLFTNFPCQGPWRCTENSMDDRHADGAKG